MHKLPLIIGHRGASGTAPENTLRSFQEAIQDKADAIEMDVQITKDKNAVVIHDAAIDRTSDGRGFVYRKTLHELKRWNYGFGKKKEEIPTLKEALECIGNRCKIILELKSSCRGNEKVILDIIGQAKYPENICVQCSYRSIIKKIRRLNPTIKIGHILLFTAVQQFLLPLDASFGRKYNVSFYSIEETFLEKQFIGKFIQKIKARGKEVYVWTINDLTSARHAMAWGVDGIITNYPGVLKQKLHWR